MAAYLGEFEQIVLLALLRLGEDAYGVTVSREIARRTGRDVSVGAVYQTLIRLEAKGLIASHLGDATPQRGGRRKKHYAIRPDGRRALRQALRALRAMAGGLDPVWGAP